MKELSTILTAFRTLPPGTRAALATVVRVEGSSYRRAGARMLIMDNGTWVGGISGGCLEGDALKRARLAMAQAEPTLVTYDTTQEDAYQIGVGLGCNGIIDVLISPLELANPIAITLLDECLTAPRQQHVLLTVTYLSGDFGLLAVGDMHRYTGPESLCFLTENTDRQQLISQISRYIAGRKSAPFRVNMADGRCLGVFIEVLLPVPHVVLLGQQYDVYPLLRLLHELGWQATVVANPQKLMRSQLPPNTTLILPAGVDHIAIDEQTAVVLMAHDFATDKANLVRVVGTNVPFIGVLGPRVRTERMVAELAATGVFIDLNERIHAPVGLDIGATSPEEIALSIVAEIKAVLSARDGSPLRLREAPIHERG